MKELDSNMGAYVMALRKRAGLILALAVLFGIVIYGVVGRLPDRHDVYFSYVVSLTEREQGGDYRFDGYYALQATDLFAATLAKWIVAPEVIAEAFDVAGVKLPEQVSGQQLSQRVRAEKTAPQLVQVTVEAEKGSEAEAVALGLQEVVQRRVAEYHEEGIPELKFRAVAGQSWSGLVGSKDYLAALAAFGLVVLVGVNVVALQVALRRQE